VDIIETRLIEDSKTVKRLAGSADRVLLDVPCSGLGVLKRNPDSKWKLNLEEISRLETLQAELLASYSKILKAGGTLVYSTCSLLPSENEQQVEKFLKNNPDFQLIEMKRMNPDQGDFDGFFMASMKKLPS
jgi:16S rRNA (cytosine967-C5)-methyltransferase